jgi:outer membrane immunogenic protein
MTRIRLAGIGLIALALVPAFTPATAADLGVKATPAPAIEPPYNWTGCYVGANFGSVFATDDWSLTSPSTSLGSHSTNALVFGGQLGCNYQISTWVLGIQGDYDAANLSGANDASGTHADLFNAGITDRSVIDSIGSVTGRLGYAWHRILFYGKGGIAWQRDKYDMFTTANNVSFTSAAATRQGATFGSGIEYAITDHLLMFFEYDYYDFGTRNSNFVVAPPALQTVGIREQESIVKIGLNWKVGGGSWWW